MLKGILFLIELFVLIVVLGCGTWFCATFYTHSMISFAKEEKVVWLRSCYGFFEFQFCRKRGQMLRFVNVLVLWWFGLVGTELENNIRGSNVGPIFNVDFTSCVYLGWAPLRDRLQRLIMRDLVVNGQFSAHLISSVLYWDNLLLQDR
ncbi:uncharacterized protein LOC126593320 [Malus sylvestris]|uniref:uncharacterized protein LOC126593320 n=1 Tax=Malus sylvestris TaxID=3752 RepID=UPI0021AD0B8B|nr:uncharacterized protein LOC126593320 [Malus sylvestris]